MRRTASTPDEYRLVSPGEYADDSDSEDEVYNRGLPHVRHKNTCNPKCRCMAMCIFIVIIVASGVGLYKLFNHREKGRYYNKIHVHIMLNNISYYCYF